MQSPSEYLVHFHINTEIPFSTLFPDEMIENPKFDFYGEKNKIIFKSLQLEASKNNYITIAQLCNTVINIFWETEEVPEGNRNPNNHIMKSSIFAVACEYMGLLNNVSYSSTRGGMMFQIGKLDDKEYRIITLREIIEDCLVKIKDI